MINMDQQKIEEVEKIYYCYKAVNKVNGKHYIGFATNPQNRWRQHKNYAKNGKGYIFHDAIRKHGWENFEFEIICCGKNKQEMLEFVEPVLIDQYQSNISQHGYNMHKKVFGASFRSTDTRRKRTPEEREILSEIHIKRFKENPEHKLKIKEGLKIYYENGGTHGMQGKKHSEESLKKMSETTKAMITDEQKEQCRQMSIDSWQNPEQRESKLKRIQNPSLETRDKMSKAKKGKPTPITVEQSHSPEAIEKRRAKMIGRKPSDEIRLKRAQGVKDAWTDERKQQYSESQKGHKFLTESSKEKIGNATRHFNFKVTHPDGYEEIIVSLSPFCENHGIKPDTARAASHTGRYIKSGYTFLKIPINTIDSLSAE